MPLDVSSAARLRELTSDRIAPKPLGHPAKKDRRRSGASAKNRRGAMAPPIDWLLEATYRTAPWYRLYRPMVFTNRLVEEEYLVYAFRQRGGAMFAVSLVMWVSLVFTTIATAKEGRTYDAIHTDEYRDKFRSHDLGARFVALVATNFGIGATLLLGVVYLFSRGLQCDFSSNSEGSGAHRKSGKGATTSLDASQHLMRNAWYSEIATFILLVSSMACGIACLLDNQFQCHRWEARATSIFFQEAAADNSSEIGQAIQAAIILSELFGPSIWASDGVLDEVRFRERFGTAFLQCQYQWPFFLALCCLFFPLALQQVGPRAVFSIPVLILNAAVFVLCYFGWSNASYISFTDGVHAPTLSEIIEGFPDGVATNRFLPSIPRAVCLSLAALAALSYMLLRAVAESSDRQRFKLFCVSREQRAGFQGRTRALAEATSTIIPPSAAAAESLANEIILTTATGANGQLLGAVELLGSSAKRPHPPSPASIPTLLPWQNTMTRTSSTSSTPSDVPPISALPSLSPTLQRRAATMQLARSIRASCAAVEVVNAEWGAGSSPDTVLKVLAAVDDLLSELIVQQRVCGMPVGAFEQGGPVSSVIAQFTGQGDPQRRARNAGLHPTGARGAALAATLTGPGVPNPNSTPGVDDTDVAPRGFIIHKASIVGDVFLLMAEDVPGDQPAAEEGVLQPTPAFALLGVVLAAAKTITLSPGPNGAQPGGLPSGQSPSISPHRSHHHPVHLLGGGSSTSGASETTFAAGLRLRIGIHHGALEMGDINAGNCSRGHVNPFATSFINAIAGPALVGASEALSTAGPGEVVATDAFLMAIGRGSPSGTGISANAGVVRGAGVSSTFLSTSVTNQGANSTSAVLGASPMLANNNFFAVMPSGMFVKVPRSTEEVAANGAPYTVENLNIVSRRSANLLDRGNKVPPTAAGRFLSGSYSVTGGSADPPSSLESTHSLKVPVCVAVDQEGRRIIPRVPIGSFFPYRSRVMGGHSEHAGVGELLRAYPTGSDGEYMLVNNMWSGPESNVVSTTNPQQHLMQYANPITHGIQGEYDPAVAGHTLSTFHPYPNALMPQHSSSGAGGGVIALALNRAATTSASMAAGPMGDMALHTPRRMGGSPALLPSPAVLRRSFAEGGGPLSLPLPRGPSNVAANTSSIPRYDALDYADVLFPVLAVERSQRMGEKSHSFGKRFHIVDPIGVYMKTKMRSSERGRAAISYSLVQTVIAAPHSIRHAANDDIGVSRFASTAAESDFSRWSALFHAGDVGAGMLARGFMGLFIVGMTLWSASARLSYNASDPRAAGLVMPAESSSPRSVTRIAEVVPPLEMMADGLEYVGLLFAGPVVAFLAAAYCFGWRAYNLRDLIQPRPHETGSTCLGSILFGHGEGAYSLITFVLSLVVSGCIIGGCALAPKDVWGHAIGGWVYLSMHLFISNCGVYPLLPLMPTLWGSGPPSEVSAETYDPRTSMASHVATTLLTHGSYFSLQILTAVQLALSLTWNDSMRRSEGFLGNLTAITKSEAGGDLSVNLTELNFTNVNVTDPNSPVHRVTISIAGFLVGMAEAATFDEATLALTYYAVTAFLFLFCIIGVVSEHHHKAIRTHYAMIVRLYSENLRLKVTDAETYQKIAGVVPRPLQPIFLKHALRFSGDVDDIDEQMGRLPNTDATPLRFDLRYPMTRGGTLAALSIGMQLPNPSNVTCLPTRIHPNTVVMMIRADHALRPSSAGSPAGRDPLTPLDSMARLVAMVEKNLLFVSDFYVGATAMAPTAAGISVLPNNSRPTPPSVTAKATSRQRVGEPSAKDLEALRRQMSNGTLYDAIQRGDRPPEFLQRVLMEERDMLVAHAPLCITQVAGDIITIVGPLNPFDPNVRPDRVVDGVHQSVALASLLLLQYIDADLAELNSVVTTTESSRPHSNIESNTSGAVPRGSAVSLAVVVTAGSVASTLSLSAAPWCVPDRRVVPATLVTGAPMLVCKDLLSAVPRGTQQYLIARDVCTASNSASVSLVERGRQMNLEVDKLDLANLEAEVKGFSTGLSPTERVLRAHKQSARLLGSISMENSEVRAARNRTFVEVHSSRFVYN